MNKKISPNRQNAKLKSKKEKEKKPKKENKAKTRPIIKKSFPLPPQPENFKQINHLYDTGKLELVDYKGNITECNIYGVPNKKFLRDITGIISYKERLNKGFIKEIKYNSNKSLYIPKNLHFEGSPMFPRPLSLPFVSQLEDPQKLVDQVKKEKRAKVLLNKKLFSLNKPMKDLGAIPNFICHKIGKNSPDERNYLIKKIDDYIYEQKIDHYLKSDYVQKSPVIKSLNKYKKKLKENMTNELYNGKKISFTNKKDLMVKYDSIRKAIYHNGLKNRNILNNLEENNKVINYDIYKKLYKIKGVGNKNSIFKKSNMLLNGDELLNNKNNNYNNTDYHQLSYSVENEKYKTLYSQRKDNKYINSIMTKTFSVFNKNNKKDNDINKEKDRLRKQYNSEYFMNTDENFKKTLTTEFDKNNEESLTINTFYLNNDKLNTIYNNNKNLYTPSNLFLKSKNCLSNYKGFNTDKFNKTLNSFSRTTRTSLTKIKNYDKNNNIITYTEKENEKDNYSNLSEEGKKNDNNYTNKFKIGFNFKSIKDLSEKASKEKDLLKGYTINEVRIEKKVKIYKNKKRDMTLKHYMNELELIKKVNKIHLEKEKRININRDNMLKKKIEGKKILELNLNK